MPVSAGNNTSALNKRSKLTLSGNKRISIEQKPDLFVVFEGKANACCCNKNAVQ